jgi:hypothetical protein
MDKNPDLPLREKRVCGVCLDVRCEPLVEPEVGPPPHRHEVSKPLMCHLVRDVHHNPLPKSQRAVWFREEAVLAVRDESPVSPLVRGEVGGGGDSMAPKAKSGTASMSSLGRG